MPGGLIPVHVLCPGCGTERALGDVCHPRPEPDERTRLQARVRQLEVQLAGERRLTARLEALQAELRDEVLDRERRIAEMRKHRTWEAA